MKLNLDAVLKTPEGDEYKTDKKEPLKLRVILGQALNSLGDQKISAEEKYQRYLMLRALDKKDFDFTIENLKTMKDAVNQFAYLPYVHGLVCDLLDGKEVG